MLPLLLLASLPGCFAHRSTAAHAGDERAAAGGSGNEIETLVSEAAKTFSVDEDLLLAVIWVESRFRPDATSPAGAVGLMQLMPDTYKRLGHQLGEENADPLDPAFNVRAGAYYLRSLLDRFGGDERLALAAYVTGEGRVSRWQRAGTPLPDACRRYAEQVLAAREAFARGDSPNPQERIPDTVQVPSELDGRQIEDLIRQAEEKGKAGNGTPPATPRD